MGKKTVVVVGATASGKTSLGVHIASRFNGEVISADSMQIYKGLNVSTAKPTQGEMQGVKHHLLDFLDITEKYSVSSFCRDAENVFDDITRRNKLPIIVGGTGLYIDSFLSNTRFLESASSETIRDDLKREFERNGIEKLYNELKSVDPKSAATIHPNNTVRVLRALEIYRTTGKTLSEQNAESHDVDSDIKPLYIGIGYFDRNILYDRINRRVDLMVENGLLDEARDFFNSSPSVTAVNAIGCKELLPFINGTKDFELCIEDLKRETRHYAKRQITWFRRNKSINWFYADLLTQKELFDNVDDLVNNFLGW